MNDADMLSRARLCAEQHQRGVRRRQELRLVEMVPALRMGVRISFGVPPARQLRISLGGRRKRQSMCRSGSMRRPGISRKSQISQIGSPPVVGLLHSRLCAAKPIFGCQETRMDSCRPFGVVYLSGFESIQILYPKLGFPTRTADVGDVPPCPGDITGDSAPPLGA